jgi:hypothetical protein
MTDLISFVRARLDEREALYRKFVQPPADPRSGPHESWAMRDVAAQRAIVDQYDSCLRTEQACYEMCIDAPYVPGLVMAFKASVQFLAAIDSDHPDYDETWKP